ncbi:IS110 family transposase [Vibrio campbellii]|uniref:IS110 family transposase n=2 Tax=Vibrio TaxID=662 RepID=UPI0005EFF196|nr:IS110 family transposase [Vibrio campbellii]
MQHIALIGIDLGKYSFHIHCQDISGRKVLRKKLTRIKLFEFLANTPATTVVMEACAGSHYMARKISNLGHSVKLIAAQFVRPYVKSNKNDYIDAEAICEAASRPSMRFVTPKTELQQSMNAWHRTRESLVRDRVKTTNQMHAFLLEFGISLPKGKAVIRRLSSVLNENELPDNLVRLLLRLHDHFVYLDEQIKDIEKILENELKSNDASKLLLTIPGIGPITASLLHAQLGDGLQYRTSRDFASSTGLVPRQYSTGGKQSLLGISKRGNKTLRRLLVQGARSFMRYVHLRDDLLSLWVKEQLNKKHSNIVACALANKLARIAWAVSVKKEAYSI